MEPIKSFAGVWTTRCGTRVRVYEQEQSGTGIWEGHRLDMDDCAACGHDQDDHQREDDKSYCMGGTQPGHPRYCGCHEFKPAVYSWDGAGNSLQDEAFDLMERRRDAVTSLAA